MCMSPFHLFPDCFYALLLLFFFFNDTATTEIYTLSLHDALPIFNCTTCHDAHGQVIEETREARSEEHTSELQSPKDLVCRLLLEKKKKKDRRTETETNKNKRVTDGEEQKRE